MPTLDAARLSPDSTPASRASFPPTPNQGLGHELFAVAIATAAAVAALGLMVGATFLMRAAQIRLIGRLHEPLALASAPAGPQLDAARFVHGRSLFTATCAMCHGPTGQGVPGLGKDLVYSQFVFERNDAQVVAFIRTGRPADDPLNTTKVPMPPMGGNPNFTASDLDDIVVFLRGLQDPRRLPEVLPAPTLPAIPQPTEVEAAAALAAAGGDEELAGYIAHGNKVYAASCAACHGKDAHGMVGLGKDLISSDFVRKLDDDALLDFLLKGRDPGDPLNTTKVAMPPKGGNPALNDDDLLDVIAYLRSLQTATGSAPASP